VPAILGNEARLGQVLVNLLVNATQAFPERRSDNNRIRVATRSDEANRVVVEVEDNGKGMSPEVQQRIFDPFFTTKPVGEGTGLGLAICHTIVQSMGGQIEVRSTPGRGTTFVLSLPTFAQEDEEDGTPSRTPMTEGREPERLRAIG
jgi:signal transduction histidine kinase